MRDSSVTVLSLLCVFAWVAVGASPEMAVAARTGAALDLSEAVVVASAAEGPQAKTVDMLLDEIEVRSGVRPAQRTSMPSARTPAIVLGVTGAVPGGAVSAPSGAAVPAKMEGYAIWVDVNRRAAPTVYLVGHDARGMLFAVGRLLRLLRLSPGRIALDPNVRIATAPQYPIRGHQLGYRHTANSYDAWDVRRYEQYVRDLILFGANSIELISSSGRSNEGPVMRLTQREMNPKLIELIHSYGLDVWIWEPLEGDVRKPAVAERALKDRLAFYKKCATIDHVMVPGGDPGRTTPKVLMPWLERHAKVLRQVFPKAGLWVSNQKFKPDELDDFFGFIDEKRPKWLTGVVFGPGTGITLEETRRRLPKQYPIRRYPDITHNVRCQYPVPAWDGIWAQTLGREAMNPRPKGTAHIHNVLARWSQGFVSYSDGCHDDLNKMIWSALGWDPDADVGELLRDYGRVFFGDKLAEPVAEGLHRLERNLDGFAATNEGVDATLAHWQGIEADGGEALAGNWRLQLYLFRAFFDAHIRSRRVVEMGYEAEVYAALAKAGADGAGPAIQAAREALARADRIRTRPDLRLRIEELGVALMQSIGLQLSVDEPYRARGAERGALLDKVDRPVNDRPWLEAQFGRILAEADAQKRLAMIEEIVKWDDPGPGGFYDDLGNTNRQPHLVRQTTWMEDPGFQDGPQEAHYKSMNNTTCDIEPLKLSWLDYAQTTGDTPLRMHYEGLEPGARYRLRVTYFGRYRAVMRLVVDDKYEIHDALPMPTPVWPREFDIPQEATKDGKLDLAWHLVDRRGCQVSEVWLVKRAE